MKTMVKSSPIAPCGMNCALCLGYQREKNKCPGCNSTDPDKPNYCNSCIIRNCEIILNSKSKFCFNCNKYPCRRLRDLDKRYRTRYGMSMIENLDTIRETGIRKFIKQEKEKWTCINCGEIICVHRENCLACDAKTNLETRKENLLESMKSQ